MWRSVEGAAVGSRGLVCVVQGRLNGTDLYRGPKFRHGVRPAPGGLLRGLSSVWGPGPGGPGFSPSSFDSPASPVPSARFPHSIAQDARTKYD